MSQHPLGHNYGWVVSTDRGYASRELTTELHDVLSCVTVAQDRHMAKLEQVLGFPVIIAVRLGVRSVHTRVYNRKEVESGSDCLSSRMNGRDDHSYLVFNETGGLEVVEGVLRARAQSHTPVLYADRQLSPQQVATLDGLQSHMSGRLSKSIGLPEADRPIDVDGWVYDEPPTPTLEPVNIHQMR